MFDFRCPGRPSVSHRIVLGRAFSLAMVCIALMLPPPPVASQEGFSLSADLDDATGNQGVTAAEVSPEAAVSIQVFASNVGQAQALSFRLVYDSGQVLYDGAEPGDLFPDARLSEQAGTNPTSVTLDVASPGGRASAAAGLVGTARFRTSAAFTGTTIRIVEAVPGGDGQQDTLKLSVAIRLIQAPAGPSPDFDADGTVGFPDFLLFASHFGSTAGDGGYDASFDLDADGSVGFADFLNFAARFGQSVPVPSPDRDALVAFYDATGGYNWTIQTNWLTDHPISTWHGVSFEDGRVTGLSLAQNSLTGAIPSELGNLAGLTGLSLSANELSGTIPAMLENLKRLKILYLDQNELTGAIPSELGNLTELAHLSLFHNRLNGPIPATLGNLSNLEVLQLHQNALDGPIPPELGDLADLNHLNLYQNQLSGTIPSELGNLADLTVLNLDQNRLAGAIPSELGNLADLTVLNLSQNQLTGAIPSELGDLGDLNHLSLHENQLSGPIPAALGNLSNLESLQFHRNALNGPVPSELGNLIRLVFLTFNATGLSGALPQSLTALSELEGFYFRGDGGLCAPLDRSFQAWLQAIENFDGPNCSQ